MQIYPTRLIFSEEWGKTLPFDLEVKGPVKGFTAELDLERGRIRVWGEGMRYSLFAEEQGIWIDWEKGAENARCSFHVQRDMYPRLV